jgi:Domain of unknown function (DUF1857)
MATPIVNLHHEHLVRINDPANPVGVWLSREQLWAGLHHTIMTPQVLDESIDAASIESVGKHTVRREIRRGKQTLIDEVDLVEGESLTIRADTQGVFAGSTLAIRIEEPAPEVFFVRFVYDVCGLTEVRDQEEDTARRAAYQASDIERVRQARRFVCRPH